MRSVPEPDEFSFFFFSYEALNGRNTLAKNLCKPFIIHFWTYLVVQHLVEKPDKSILKAKFNFTV